MKFNKNVALVLGAVAGIFTAPVFAAGEGSAAFTAAITSVSADIATYGAALVGVSAVGVAFMVGIKYVKKIKNAS